VHASGPDGQVHAFQRDHRAEGFRNVAYLQNRSLICNGGCHFDASALHCGRFSLKQNRGNSSIVVFAASPDVRPFQVLAGNAGGKCGGGPVVVRAGPRRGRGNGGWEECRRFTRSYMVSPSLVTTPGSIGCFAGTL